MSLCCLSAASRSRFIGEGSAAITATTRAAITALADWLSESADETSAAAMIQHFKGTVHEVALASAQADVMQWGDDFDVAAEFSGSLLKLSKDADQREIETLHAKMQGKGTSALDEQERARYLLLLQRSQTSLTLG